MNKEEEESDHENAESPNGNQVGTDEFDSPLKSEFNEPSISNMKSNETTDEDSKYIKYVWNKRTKRLEKRDLRQTNLESIDKYKFERFEKVNQKSKVLCQPSENYLNTSFFGDFSPEDAKRELLYGI